MKISSIVYWLIAVVVLGFLYSQWFSSYNASVQAWEPIVKECSEHGGFMTANGTCDYNQ